MMMMIYFTHNASIKLGKVEVGVEQMGIEGGKGCGYRRIEC